MLRICLVISLSLALSACTAGVITKNLEKAETTDQWQDTSDTIINIHGSYRFDHGDVRLSSKDIWKLEPLQLNRAIMALKNSKFIKTTNAIARSYVGAEYQPKQGSTPYLVRAVYRSPLNAIFSLSWNKKSGILMNAYSVLGSSHPEVKFPLVVNLDGELKELYVYIQGAM